MNTKEYCRPEVKCLFSLLKADLLRFEAATKVIWKASTIWSLLNLRNGNQMPWNKITNN